MKEAKQKAGPSGQIEKNKEKAECPVGVKSSSRRDEQRKAQRTRQQQQQVQAVGAQDERNTMCVGVLHVSSRVGWRCHMIECTESYHALRECSFNEEGEEPEAL